MTIDTILTKLLMLPGIILGLSLHEFAHAWLSNKLGDPTPKLQGRLTINPLAHIDWVGFAALVLVGFGWGRRRSLGRVSVPMWPVNLSVRLLIVDLVSRYPTNYLIRRKPIY